MVTPIHAIIATLAESNYRGENNTLERLTVEEDMEKVHRLRLTLVIDVEILHEHGPATHDHAMQFKTHAKPY
jgi:hypothetical protein